MNEMICWLAILILSIIVEIISLGLTSIWFAGGALIAFIAAALHAPVWLQVILFLVVTIVLLIFTRPVAVKYFNKNRVRTNVESVVGRQAIVTATIDNLKGTGQVTIGGQEWSARSADDKVILEVGSVVNVHEVSGVKVIVSLNEDADA